MSSHLPCVPSAIIQLNTMIMKCTISRRPAIWQIFVKSTPYVTSVCDTLCINTLRDIYVRKQHCQTTSFTLALLEKYHSKSVCDDFIWSTFWKSNFKQQLGCRFDLIDDESYFFVFWHMQLYMSWYIRSFFGFTFSNILYFFKYSCTNIFHRRSLYTFNWIWWI